MASQEKPKHNFVSTLLFLAIIITSHILNFYLSKTGLAPSASTLMTIFGCAIFWKNEQKLYPEKTDSRNYWAKTFKLMAIVFLVAACSVFISQKEQLETLVNQTPRLVNPNVKATVVLIGLLVAMQTLPQVFIVFIASKLSHNKIFLNKWL